MRVLHGLALRLRRPARPGHVGSAAPGAPSIALFHGCLARALEPEVMAAARSVFTRLGVATTTPAGQVCCGAMHRHNGFPEAADAMLAENRAVFAGTTVVGGASACVAELRPALPATELCRALLDIPWPESVALRPLSGTVAVHEPCSQRNQLRDTRAVYDLLARIPGLRILPLPGNESCCGAAGTYLLDHPQTAEQLAADKVDALTALRPRWLVTTNTGCAAHLAAAAAAAGLDVEVVHPVVLLARSLDPDR